MAKLDTVLFSFHGKEYLVATIPDIFTGGNDGLMIGTQSLNVALYDDENGYIDEEARYIDEQIYAYIDDRDFSLTFEKFLDIVNSYLD